MWCKVKSKSISESIFYTGAIALVLGLFPSSVWAGAIPDSLQKLSWDQNALLLKSVLESTHGYASSENEEGQYIKRLEKFRALGEAAGLTLLRATALFQSPEESGIRLELFQIASTIDAQTREFRNSFQSENSVTEKIQIWKELTAQASNHPENISYLSKSIIDYCNQLLYTNPGFESAVEAICGR